MTVSGKSSNRKSGSLLDFRRGAGREAGVGRRAETDVGVGIEGTIGVPVVLGP